MEVAEMYFSQLPLIYNSALFILARSEANKIVIEKHLPKVTFY
jgi:hypothetical protein